MTYLSRFTSAPLLLLFWVVVAPVTSFAQQPAQQQQEEPASTRKVVSRAAAEYPELARTMRLKGSVKVEAVVAPNGTVKTVQIKGGHPVLAQAAEKAVRKWKWESATRESLESVEFRFGPQ